MQDPKNIEIVLSSTSASLLNKQDIYEILSSWLGQGILTANGERWTKHRKIITPSFHFQILQDFLHIMNETSERFVKLLDGFAKTEEIFDLQEIVPLSTLDVICEAAMGTRINTIENKNSPILLAINDICLAMTHRAFSAVNRSDFLYSFTSDYRKQQKALKLLKKEFSKIIEERKEYLEKNRANLLKTDNEFKKRKMAFLDNLLTVEKDGRHLTFNEIFDEVSTFMFEGHDTTSSAITFALHCLSRHAAVQEKALEEQYHMFGNDKSSSPSYQQLQDMKYLESIIKETLRIYPSVPMIVRTTTEMTKVGSQMVPPNTNILIAINSMGLNENLFPNPYQFKPERWENEEITNMNAFHYVPFSAGPRNCIGQKFAMMELKVTLSKIIRNFMVLPPVEGLYPGIHDQAKKPSGPYEIRLASLVTLKSVNGVFIRLRSRS